MNASVLLGAGYTTRKFLYEARLQEETSCNATLGRVNEAYREMYVWSVLGERNKIQCKTFH